MFKKKYYILFVLSLLTFFVKAQNKDKELDSLKKTIKSSMLNIGRVDSIQALSTELRHSNPNQALLFAQQALLISEIISYHTGISEAMYIIGNIYEDKSGYKKSLNYYSLALKFFQKANNQLGIAKCFQSIGNIYASLGDLKKSLDYYIQSLDIYKEIKDSKGKASLLNNIGLIYTEIQHYEDALANFEAAAKIFKEIDDQRGIAITKNNLATIYEYTEQYDLALKNYNLALKIFSSLKDKASTANTLNGIADVLKKRNDVNQALEKYLKALKIGKTVDYKLGEGYSLRGIGDLYQTQRNYDRALDYFNQSLDIYIAIGTKPEIADNYERLATVKDELGEIETANSYYRLAKTYRDSIYNETVRAQIAEIQAKSDLEDKKQEIEELSEVHKTTQEALEQQKIIASQKQFQFTLALMILVLVLGISILFYYSRIKIRKINKELIHKNEKVKKVNEELEQQTEQLNKAFIKISDSIRYAEAVQSAFLPEENKIREIIGEHFIIYKAKDIVSGDFFWIGDVDMYGTQKKVVSVIDCTGHGFAGGLMSMIAHTLLNEIILQEQIYSPAEVLRLMHRRMLDVLIKNPSENVHIGMELSMCFLESLKEEEHMKTKVTFAGAKQSLFIVNHHGFTELRGDRKSVGFQTEQDRTFTNREVILDKGAVIYLTTDGYADQANEKGKRIGSPKVKALMQEIAEQPMKEQRQFLESFLSNFQGSTEQRDDITLIGIKI